MSFPREKERGVYSSGPNESVRTSRTGRNFAANILITAFKIQIRRLREDHAEAVTATVSAVGVCLNAVRYIRACRYPHLACLRHETHAPLVQRDVNFP